MKDAWLPGGLIAVRAMKSNELTFWRASLAAWMASSAALMAARAVSLASIAALTISNKLPCVCVVEDPANLVDLGGLFDLEDPGAPVPVAPVALLDSMESVETVDPEDLAPGTSEESDAENE